MKDMMAGAQRDARAAASAARIRGSRSSWSSSATSSRRTRRTLDELLEQMAQRMAAMQAMLNSMTPEQRAQLQQLSEQLLGGHGPALADGPARPEPAADVPADGLGPAATTSRARTRWASAQAMQTMQELGDLDQLENLLRNATEPGGARRGRHGPGARPARRRRGPVARAAGRAGQDAGGRRPDRAEGGPARADARRACARSARTRCATCSRSSTKDKLGQHQIDATRPRPRAHLRDQAVRVRRPVQPRPAAHDPQRASAGNGRRHAGAARRPTTSRSSAPSTSTRSSTVLMLDLSLSMPMRDNFLPAKKVAMALHSLITSQFPRDYMGIVGFSETAARPHRRAAARGVVGLRLRHEHAARVHARPPAARRARPARSRSS